MIFLRNKTLLALLSTGVHVSGRPDNHNSHRCPSGSSSSSANGLIDCSNIKSSIGALATELGGSSFAIVSQFSDGGFYDDVIQQYASKRVAISPTYVVEAMDKLDVQATVMFASQCDYTLTTRSGGHSYIGISSCDGSESPCIQLDVRNINHIDVVELNGNQGKQLRVGPGTILEELADKFVLEGVFLPTGECTDVGIGGHQQTGGLSASWSHTFGYFAHHVESFEIVLPADGSRVVVENPKGGSTSDLNDDLFYSVLGGASGSYGTIVETTFNTFKDDDYFAQYWEVYFLFDETTFGGLVSMFRKFAEMLGDEDFTSDTRWNIEWTIIGGKTLYNQAFKDLGVPGFNFVQIDFTYVVKSNGLDEDQAKAEAQEIYDTLVGACTDCLTLDEHFELTLPNDYLIAAFKGKFPSGKFPSVYGVTGPISQLISELTLFDFSQLGVSPFPYNASWQQGPEFPNEDEVEEILNEIKVLMPTFETVPSLPLDAVFVISQWVVMPAAVHAKSDIALPFQNDVYGIVLDAWDLTGGDQRKYLHDSLRKVRDLVIASTGGEDHRMFWNPDEETCLACGDSKYYYDDQEKFDRLREIKSCVDPNMVFDSRMAMPLSDE